MEDVFLYPEDLLTIAPRAWVNDAIISFHMEYCNELASPQRLQCLLPSTVQWLMADTQHDTESLKNVPLDQARFFFCPINDSQQWLSLSDKGQHWSLLICDRSEMSFLHLDSLKGKNNAVAERFARVLCDILQQRKNEESSIILEVPVDGPQQNNGYDCGIWLMLCTELLSQHLNRCKHIADSSLSDLWRQWSENDKAFLRQQDTGAFRRSLATRIAQRKGLC
jgi:sentrin-specific protease 8